MYVPKSALKVTGPEAKYATLHAESGRQVSRGWCTNCGSNLFILAELVPTMQGLWAGSLDDPSIFKPQINVWTRSAPAWSGLDPGLKKLDVAPNADQFQALLDEAAAESVTNELSDRVFIRLRRARGSDMSFTQDRPRLRRACEKRSEHVSVPMLIPSLTI